MSLDKNITGATICKIIFQTEVKMIRESISQKTLKWVISTKCPSTNASVKVSVKKYREKELNIHKMDVTNNNNIIWY